MPYLAYCCFGPLSDIQLWICVQLIQFIEKTQIPQLNSSACTRRAVGCIIYPCQIQHNPAKSSSDILGWVGKLVDEKFQERLLGNEDLPVAGEGSGNVQENKADRRNGMWRTRNQC